MRTVFIINPRSGPPKYITRIHDLIRKYFGAHTRNVSVYKVHQPEQICQIAKQAVDDGADIAVAVGGDGTINGVACALLHTETALGVLPTGSGNGFARNVGIPLRLDDALKLLVEPNHKRIDIGRVSEHIFLVSCGIGWEAMIATLFENSRLRGVVSYTSAVLTTMLQFEPQQIEITAQPNDWHYKGRPLLFSIANMRELGVGATIAPNARYDDGLLDICLIPRHDLLNIMKYAPELFRAQTDRIPGFINHQANRIRITRPYPGNIHLDGTPLPAGEVIEIELLPLALKIVTRPQGQRH